MRKTKILCTLGPASSSSAMIGELLDAGMNAVRLNFSHGTHADHAANIERVREAARDRERMVPIVADLQGPKIRTGKLRGGEPVALVNGSRFRLTPEPIADGDAERVSIDYACLAQDVEPGDKVLLADGAIQLEVIAVEDEDVVCEVRNDGVLGERKGVNVPGAEMSLPSITEKDKRDLDFALSRGVEFVAQSFVRSAADVQVTQALIKQFGASAQLIAKIEKPQALDELDGVLEAADGVMIARGDLGVELNPWQVPIAQRRIIEASARWRKPVITATQMLESMISSPRPTRAEASDVANAVFDGSDALMLSAETAVGKYPAASVAMMAKIIETAEQHSAGPNFELGPAPLADDEFSADVAHSATRLAEQLGARYIVVYTETGYSAQLVSKHHPTCSIAAFSRHSEVCRRVKLLWGVRTHELPQVQALDELVALVDATLVELGWVDAGDLIVLVAGTPFLVGGRTNLIKLHRIGQG